MEAFGRYLLIRRLAEGGMGELYLAQQAGIAGFAKHLVVKRIKPALAGDKTFVEMFLHEARVAALIDHPNVVQIHELGRVEDRYFIAMEYVPGRSLANVMEEQTGPIELPVALYVMINVCEGLAYAHGTIGLDGQPLGLVHRDISPPNVLLGYSGSVKLSDFGIAKVRHNQQTAAGMLKGKFAYLSPEQARGEEVDIRSDIYALGLLLFEVTTGKRANPAKTDTGMVFAAAKGEVLNPNDILPDYPEPLRQIILKATQLERDARYAQVKELQEELHAYQLENRLVMTASRVGEWLRRLPGSQHTAEEPTPVESEAATVSESPSGLSRVGPATPPPKDAFAPTVQISIRSPRNANPGAVELDLAEEDPRAAKWGSQGRRANLELPSGSRGLIAVLVVTVVGFVGGAAYLFTRGMWQDPEARSVFVDIDGGPPPRRHRESWAGGPDASTDQLHAAPSKPDAGIVAAKRHNDGRPTAAAKKETHPRVPPKRSVSPDVGVPKRTAPPPPDASAPKHVYWTEGGPVLP